MQECQAEREQTTKPTNPVAAGKKRGETERRVRVGWVRASKGEEEKLSLSLSRLLLLLSFLFQSSLLLCNYCARARVPP
jgi:hypothetical protein